MKSKSKKVDGAGSGGTNKSNTQTYLWALVIAITGVGIALLLANRGGSVPPPATLNVKKTREYQEPPRKVPPRKVEQEAPPRKEEQKAPPRRRAIAAAVDKDVNCPQWAAAGECEANPDFMLSNCAASCPTATPRLARPGEPEDWLLRLDSDLIEAQRKADSEMHFDPDEEAAGTSGPTAPSSHAPT